MPICVCVCGTHYKLKRVCHYFQLNFMPHATQDRARGGRGTLVCCRAARGQAGNILTEQLVS